MSPDQQIPPGQQPQQVFQPQQQPAQPGPQQPMPPAGANGMYPVMPALPAVPNDGHSGHNPYDFIINHNTPKHSPFSNFFGGGSFVKRAIIMVGGLVILLAIVAGGAVLLTPKGNTDGLKTIAERQQEILRIVSLIDQKVSDQETKNFVANTDVSISSSQVQITTYLSGHGVKLSPQILALSRDSNTDTLLDNAAQAGTLDSTTVGTLTTQLKTYESDLRTTYKQTTNKQTKQLLQDCFTSADSLLKQAGDIKF